MSIQKVESMLTVSRGYGIACGPYGSHAGFRVQIKNDGSKPVVLSSPYGYDEAVADLCKKAGSTPAILLACVGSESGEDSSPLVKESRHVALRVYLLDMNRSSAGSALASANFLKKSPAKRTKSGTIVRPICPSVDPADCKYFKTIYSNAALGRLRVVVRMRCNNFDGYSPMFTTGTAQDFDSAFHAANGCTARTCDVVAAYRDAERQLKDAARGKGNEVQVENGEDDGSDEWTLVDEVA